jgi:exodeoxyribonuclease V alpha subunit
LKEKYIAERIINLAKKQSSLNLDETLQKVEKNMKIVYNEEQTSAIKNSILNNFLVITGGPGTGKTTIIKGICKLYQEVHGLSNFEMNKSLALLAPTGRASKRISENFIYEASTIHRFLKWNKEDNSFAINEENLSNVKIIIVDECSMIDLDLFYNLLLGLKQDIKLIMIGDSNQLPSVGPGQIFKDIIDSNCTDVCFLNHLYRRDVLSKITVLAHDITNNKFDESVFNKTKELIFIGANPNNLKDKLFSSYLQHQKDNIQVLAPIYRGLNGIDDLNNFIQKNINTTTSNVLELDNFCFKENDKVIQLVNSLDDNVFNGDIGNISSIKNNEISVNFDNNFVNYKNMRVNNLKLGYVISIHKSQGSEFDCVIIPVLNRYSNMLYKKLIYTAITRAKSNLIIVGEKEAFLKAINTNYDGNRKTSLNNFLVSFSLNNK